MRLERLDEAALFLGLEIAPNSGGAGECVGATGAGARFGLLKIEDCDSPPSDWSDGNEARRTCESASTRATELLVVPKSKPMASKGSFVDRICSIIS